MPLLTATRPGATVSPAEHAGPLARDPHAATFVTAQPQVRCSLWTNSRSTVVTCLGGVRVSPKASLCARQQTDTVLPGASRLSREAGHARGIVLSFFGSGVPDSPRSAHLLGVSPAPQNRVATSSETTIRPPVSCVTPSLPVDPKLMSPSLAGELHSHTGEACKIADRSSPT